MTMRTSALPLGLLLTLLVLAAIIVVPDSANFSQSRAIGFGVVLGAASSIIAAMLRTWETNRSRRLEVVRGAYRSMIGGTQAMLDQKLELENFPFGHPYPGLIPSPGIVSNINGHDDYYRHDPFEEAKTLEAEWRRRYAEGERELLLETDSSDDVFVAWRQVRKTFYAWLRRLETITAGARERARVGSESVAFNVDDDSELTRLGGQLRNDIEAFAKICRRRIKTLR